MKIVQINNFCGRGSTGKICKGISKYLNDNGIENYIIYSIGHTDYQYAIKCSEKFFKLQALQSRIKGNYGFNSYRTTKHIIKKLEEINPNIVHLHNMHSHNCNLELLLSYLWENNIRIIWTFHDCWTFTAYCPHYTMAKCDKWKKQCTECSQYRKYSWFKDNSKWLFNKKKEVLLNLDLTIVTPSLWLKEQVEESFLKNHLTEVIHNGINLDVFKPINSNFRQKKGIKDNVFLVLGVAIQWVPGKGADVFVELANRLDPQKYCIVLVGTDKKIEKELPNNIISIRKTENQQELAEIYTAADIFVNPTREEVFGLVNVEANACGTPVLTFNTGGSPECIDETSGSVVPCGDIDSLEKEIIRICTTKPYSKEACCKRASEFSEEKKYSEYIELYKKVLNNGA